MTLRVATAGESHGPALVAIVTGLPAGLELDRDAIDADLRRRQEGYGRSPRQQIETRQGRGARRASTREDARDAARARRPEHRPQELDVGDEPVAARGRAAGEGDEAGDAAAAGSRRPRGVQKYDLDDVRNALERASARHTAVHVAVGGVAKALLATIGVTVEGSTVDEEALRERIDEARTARDTVGGVVEVRAAASRPGSAPTRRRTTASTRDSPPR